MPAGDAQRTWFPEMVDELRRRCSAEDVKGLEQQWTAHQKANGLNLHGKLAAPPKSLAGPCGH
jgi:protein gp37